MTILSALGGRSRRSNAGGNSGSCPTGQAPAGLDASRCDPGRTDMAERVADAFIATKYFIGRRCALRCAQVALEACHHEELVEALSEAERCLTMILVDYGVDRHRPRAETATNVFRVLLTKIGGTNENVSQTER